MTIKQLGGVFGRNPTFNNVTIDGELIINGSVFTGLDYEGAWNAATNTPTLTSSVGTLGQFYIVSVAGATDLNGITNWDVGDWALFNGSVWQRVEGGANGNFSTLSVSGLATFNGNAQFPDNSKAVFGAGSDLEIYHEPNNSIIKESGGGSLLIQGDNIRLQKVDGTENMLTAVNDGQLKLFYDGAEKLATSASGVSVTGTVTADGLTVENSLSGATNLFNFQNTSNTANSNTRLKISTGGTSGGDPILQLTDNASNWYVFGDQSDSFKFKIGTSVTDNKFVMDSTGNVGIGSASDGAVLQLDKASSSYFDMQSDSALRTRIYNDSSQTILETTTNNLIFKSASSEAMRIDSSGNVGIGGSPTAPLHVFGGGILGASSTNPIAFTGSGSDNAGIGSYNANTDFNIYSAGTGNIKFLGGSTWDSTGALTVLGTEAMRIDASGNLLVGKTATGYSANGAEITSTGLLYLPAGSASAPSLTFSGDPNTGIGFGGADILYFSTGGAERMRIDASGNVGIGAAPSAWWSDLTAVENYAASGGVFASAQINGHFVTNAYYDGSNWKHRVTGASTWYYHESGTHSWHNVASGSANANITWQESMRIDASGNLLIGKTSTAFSTAGIELKANNVMSITRSAGTCINANRIGSSAGSVIQMYYDDVDVGSIDVTASATSYNTSSDQRLKENIADADDAGSKIDAIQVRKFDWKVDGSHQDYGMVAQELLEVAPEAVSQGETEDDMMGVDYSKLVPVMLKEIQSLRARVAQLES